MPVWLQIVFAVFGALGTILGIFGITAYASERMKHKASRRNRQEDIQEEELARMRHDNYVHELTTIIDTSLVKAITPLATDISEIKADMHLVKKGVQATCRNDLEDMYAKAEKDGYCSNEDKQRFETTYQVYHSLGRNGVMDAKRDRLLALPESKPGRTTKKVKKTILVENK